jgi:hypothetical protein
MRNGMVSAFHDSQLFRIREFVCVKILRQDDTFGCCLSLVSAYFPTQFIGMEKKQENDLIID